MNILGIIASSKLGVDAGDFESIATVSVGSGGAANVEFTSIPATFTHLQVRQIGRVNNSTVSIGNNCWLNSDTSTSNYTFHELVGDGASATAYGAASPENPDMGHNAGANATASVFGVGIIDILDYTNTNKYKTMRSLSGNDNNGSGQIKLKSTVWKNTNAITSIKFEVRLSGNYQQYTQFALYGIRSA
jgi:hypothetical protein